MKKLIIIIISILPYIATTIFSQGYLYTSGKKIVDGSGNEFILKGIGLGGWMLQEPYMLNFPANAQNQIRVKIELLIGKENTDTFYNAYLANGIQKADIDSLAAWGFNSIRLPMHYNLFITSGSSNTFIDKGFTMVDNLLSWCETNHIYLILDLHAAPGGNGGDTAISDIIKGQPLLWQDENNKVKTVMLWKKLAERYKDKTWIGGYDLINEPNYSFTKVGESGSDLINLYKRITDSIRKVDNNHIIFVEGNNFATDFSSIVPPWDNNMAYSFHKYWSPNDNLNYVWWVRDQNNIPLWLGESGENSNTWYADCINLVQNSNGIGWAWWTMKKFGNSGLINVTNPKGFQNLIDYWNNKVAKPDINTAKLALMELAENFRIQNCKINYDVIQAVMVLPGSTKTYPFKKLTIPGKINASDYDMGRNGYAYNDLKPQTIVQNDWGGNEGGAYRNDGVGIEICQDSQSNGFDVGWTEATDWMNYTFDCNQSAIYDVAISYASQTNTGSLSLKIDGIVVASNISLPSTGGWQNWQTTTIHNIKVIEGAHILQAYVNAGGFNLSYIQFKVIKVEIKKLSKNEADCLELFPNPVNDVLSISFPNKIIDNLKISIFDLNGKNLFLIIGKKGSKFPEINIKDLQPGCYILKATIDNIIFKKLFIKT